MGDGSVERKYCVVISRNSINAKMNVVVARITGEDRHRSLPTAVELNSGEGNLTERCFVLCHDLLTISQDWLDPRAKGDLPLGKLIEVEHKLRHALDLDQPPNP
jgi:mRNA-degrading endonuclease toxin of MazEF toxin-antitoxin module